MVNTMDNVRADAIARLRKISDGFDGTGLEARLNAVAEDLEQGQPLSTAAQRLAAIADGVDGTGTEASIREVIASIA